MMYGAAGTFSASGASRPTPSAPAVAPSAVRHHASQVRSAAMPVRLAAPGSPGFGSSAIAAGCSHSAARGQQDTMRLVSVLLFGAGIAVALAGRWCGLGLPVQLGALCVLAAALAVTV